MSECHRDHSKKVSLQVCPLFCLDIFSIFQYISWSYPSFSTPLAALPLDSLSPEASTSATTTITTTTVARAAGWFFWLEKTVSDQPLADTVWNKSQKDLITFHRIDPNSFWMNLIMTSRRDCNDGICKGIKPNSRTVKLFSGE